MSKSTLLTILSLTFVLTSKPTFALNAKKRSFASSCSQTLQEPLSADALEKRIEECDLTKIEELLPLLPESYRSRYVLIFASRGLQQGSKENPRAILFGHDARFVLTFNGDPTDRGYGEIETMSFNDQTKSFEFRGIDFASEKPPGEPPIRQFMCMNCHGRGPGGTPRPYWDGFPLWPGSYGGELDLSFRASTGANETQDQNAYTKFMESRNTHPRYRHLMNQANLAPNTQFGIALSHLNLSAIAREISQETKLTPYRFALIGALLCGSHIPVEDFIPLARRQVFQRSVADFEKASAPGIVDNFARRITRLGHIYPGAPETTLIQDLNRAVTLNGADNLEDTKTTNRVRYIVDNLLGDRVEKWSMAPGLASATFADSSNDLQGLASPLADELLKSSDPDVWALLQTFPRDDAHLCARLKTESLGTL